MKNLPFWLLCAWTISGAFFFFAEAGSLAWWDVGWVVFLVSTSYGMLVSVGGLARARTCAGIVLGVFSVIIALTAVTGWPLGAVRFTGPAALRLGNLFPLLPPLVAFAFLTLSQRASAIAFSSVNATLLAAITSAVFLATTANALLFLSKIRLWWLWNPWGEQANLLILVVPWLALGFVSFLLARFYPEDNGLKLSQWSPAAIVLIILNILFLAVNVRVIGIH